MTRTVVSAECLSTAAALTVRCQVMTAHWFGASAPIVSICTAYSSGSTPSRCSSSAQCVARNGSSKSDNHLSQRLFESWGFTKNMKHYCIFMLFTCLLYCT
ncbi:hypothetical protein SKAU_G00397270 [Synaphobranchus kaupii]|uniref:Uncharacterized protein n=1 Tax=Synaphobranchus kaupii TaxID=118154 RepID=A0A9Q1E8C2_SYNKA|nr:hypothetical protein SKAU_G00397270 [Synaphobranchus kaupii]